jgi:hypothetical protein
VIRLVLRTILSMPGFRNCLVEVPQLHGIQSLVLCYSNQPLAMNSSSGERTVFKAYECFWESFFGMSGLNHHLRNTVLVNQGPVFLAYESGLVASLSFHQIQSYKTEDYTWHYMNTTKWECSPIKYPTGLRWSRLACPVLPWPWYNACML